MKWMLNPISTQSVSDSLIYYIPSFVFSLLVAEFFFKFHSFTLELLAFLFTWYGMIVITRTIHSLFIEKQNIQDDK